MWWLPIVLLLAAVPVVAILADTYLKAKQLDAYRAQDGDSYDLEKDVEELRIANQRLQERIHNLEVILTDASFQLPDPAPEPSKKVKKIGSKSQNRDYDDEERQ